MLFGLRSFLQGRRLRRRTRRLLDIGFTSSEAWRIAESADAFVDASGGLTKAIQDADAWWIRMALQNMLTRAELAKDLAQQIEDRIPAAWRRLQKTMPPAGQSSTAASRHPGALAQ